MDVFETAPGNVRLLLDSVVKNYNITEEELYFKCITSLKIVLTAGESWCFKLGGSPDLSVDNVTMFKQDIQNQLELTNQSKLKQFSTPTSIKRTPKATNTYDNFLTDITPVKRVKREPGSSFKSSNLVTPSRPVQHSPLTPKLAEENSTPFADRKDKGAILQTLDPRNISITFAPTAAPRLTVNFDAKKYSYRPMYQKLSEVSEILDDQIDQYADLVLESLSMSDEDLGNPSLVSQTECTVVGRIVCDSLDGGRLNAASMMLEASRRLGIGTRTKLDLSSLSSYSFFPGQLVAFKGTNGNGDFRVSEIVLPKILPPTASSKEDLRSTTASVLIAAGPYTSHNDLSFEALHALKEVIRDTKPESVILIGPFLDLTHPLIQSGAIDSEAETLDDLFKELITPILEDIPNLILIPHINDAVSRHPCYPQEAIPRGTTSLPKTIKLLPNPALFSLDEVSFGILSNDILKHLTTSETSRNPGEKNILARQAGHIIQQRRFYPLFPGPTSESGSTANLDMGFIGLSEFGARLPDILVLPSQMTPFVKVIDSVIVINPGSLSKKAGAGSYARIYIQPLKIEEQEDDQIANNVWDRARADIIRI